MNNPLKYIVAFRLLFFFLWARSQELTFFDSKNFDSKNNWLQRHLTPKGNWLQKNWLQKNWLQKYWLQKYWLQRNLTPQKLTPENNWLQKLGAYQFLESEKKNNTFRLSNLFGCFRTQVLKVRSTTVLCL